jgi:hypothetical protein
MNQPAFASIAGDLSSNPETERRYDAEVSFLFAG